MKEPKIKIQVTIDRYEYERMCYGAMLVEKELEATRGKRYEIQPEYFLHQAIVNEIDRLENKPTFEQN